MVPKCSRKRVRFRFVLTLCCIDGVNPTHDRPLKSTSSFVHISISVGRDSADTFDLSDSVDAFEFKHVSDEEDSDEVSESDDAEPFLGLESSDNIELLGEAIDL